MSFSKRKLLRMALLGSLFTVFFAVSASATDLGVGTVTADALRLRAEAVSDASILATAEKDDVVIVLEEVDETWYRVDYKSIEGYMSSAFLDLATTADVDLGYGRVRTNGTTLNVRSGPGTDYEQISTLRNGSVVSLVGIDDGWYKITTDDCEGYVSSDYIVSCLDTSGSRGDNDIVDSEGQEIVDYAMQYLGCRYVWGGNGPSCFDCSGLTKYVYGHFDYTLNRTASAQLSNGTSVTFDELQPGDLVFFNNHKVSTPVSHVGIYIGGGQFIHASTNSYCVEISNLTGHYLNTYVYARRILE